MSTMKRIPIEEASNKQLLEYAQVYMGLDVKAGIQTANLLAKIREAEPELKEIVVSDVAEAPQAAKPLPKTNERTANAEVKDIDPQGLTWLSDPKVEINIMKQNKPGGDEHVIVPVNGRVFRIIREQWVEVPYRVYLALRQSYETSYRQEWPNGPTERPVLISTDELSYPFHERNLPPEEEVQAWLERTADTFCDKPLPASERKAA